ncbi:MAG: VTT domain-containing protein [Bdellovibrionaceae bacterium]|nr:VTT domain-containing protein [Bdellovibrio sp.]
MTLLQSLLHIDVTLILWAHDWGSAIYLILFLIIFCETGLVVTPFLPGDSLLFAVGALAATGEFLDIKLIIPLLILAALLGDTTNYFVGRHWGRKLFEKENFLIKKAYLTKTEEFFEKKGFWAVSLARFFPITRTISPFFAGLSHMNYRRFLTLSVLGTLAWINIFALSGYFFGQIEFVKKNFTYLVMGIIFISVIPFVVTLLKSRNVKNT